MITAGTLSGKNSQITPASPETHDITLSYRKIGTAEKYSELIQAPAVIEISPYVTHKVEALCDFILLECNSIKDIQNDRIRDEV